MNSYFIRFINAEYEAIKSKNSRFSKRAFARKLGLDPALLIALLAGRRKPTVKMAKKIIARLQVKNPFLEEALLVSLVDETYLNFEGLPEAKSAEVDLPESWMDHALQVLLKLPPAINSKAVLAKNLGISIREMTPVLARLERLGTIRQNKSSVVLLDGGSYVYRGRGNASLDKLQMEYILKALATYQKNPVGPLKIAGATFSANVERLPEAALMITKFYQKLVKFLEDKDSKIIYRINCQLYPITVMSAEEEARCFGRKKESEKK